MESNGRCIGEALGVLAVFSVAMTVFAAPSSKPSEPPPQELYFDVDGLKRIEGAKPDSFATPRATLEHFIRSSRDGDFKRAAQALNLQHIPEEQRTSSTPTLAQKFFYVFSEKLHINFNDIPGRPTGGSIDRWSRHGSLRKARTRGRLTCVRPACADPCATRIQVAVLGKATV